MLGHKSARTQDCQDTSLLGHKTAKTQDCQDTSLSGHKTARTEVCQITRLPGQKSARTRVCQDTRLPGQKSARTEAWQDTSPNMTLPLAAWSELVSVVGQQWWRCRSLRPGPGHLANTVVSRRTAPGHSPGGPWSVQGGAAQCSPAAAPWLVARAGLTMRTLTSDQASTNHRTPGGNQDFVEWNEWICAFKNL